MQQYYNDSLNVGKVWQDDDHHNILQEIDSKEH